MSLEIRSERTNQASLEGDELPVAQGGRPPVLEQASRLEEAGAETEKDRRAAGQDRRTRTGFSSLLSFLGRSPAANPIASVDLTSEDSVRSAARALDVRLTIEHALAIFDRPLRRDVRQLLDAGGIAPDARKIARGLALARAEKAAVEKNKSARRLEKANERLAPYGLRMSMSEALGASIRAVLDDVPAALIDRLQAHRAQQPRPAGGDLDAWIRYGASHGLTYGEPGLLEADGKTIAADLSYSVVSPTRVRLSGYTGARNGWEGHDLETALVAKLLADHPGLRSIELELMEGTRDFDAFVAAGGDRAAVEKTPLAQAFGRFRSVSAELKGRGVDEPTKWIRDTPEWAAIVLRLDPTER